MSEFKFVDICAGLGGFHLALAELGGECVFASEILESLRSLYLVNHGMVPAGDLWDVEPASVPQHDVLCAGFPCQPFSKAGAQLGWRDAVRGTIFQKIAQIIEFRRPEFVILENVANFVRHDSGNTYSKVVAALSDMGYEVSSKRLSPHQFGIPQVRERMFMVGHRRDRGGLGKFSWPQPTNEKLDIASILEHAPPEARSIPKHIERALDAWQNFLDAFPAEGKLPSFPIWAHEFGANYPIEVDSLKSLSIKELQGVRGSFGDPLPRARSKAEMLLGVPSYARGEKEAFPLWKQQFIMQNRALYESHRSWLDSWMPEIREFPSSLQKLEWNCQGEVRDIYSHILQIRASGIRVKRRSTSPALVAMTTSQIPIIGWHKRYMTTLECARLQSMGTLRVLPSTQNEASTALGNAVNVKVVTVVARQLLATKLARSGHALNGTSHAVEGGQARVTEPIAQ